MVGTANDDNDDEDNDNDDNDLGHSIIVDDDDYAIFLVSLIGL